VLLALCIGFLSAPVCYAAAERTEEEARKKYASAFDRGLKIKRRVEILEAVVKDYSDTAWADDALWLLGEVADRYGYPKRAVHFRRQLVGRDLVPRLEAFTQAQPVYRRSRIPQILFVLERGGYAYAVRGDKTFKFNPLPVATHEELAQGYLELGMTEQALEHYRGALAATPAGCIFADIYSRRIDEIEEELELEKALEGEHKAQAEESDQTQEDKPTEPEDNRLTESTDTQQDNPEQDAEQDSDETAGESEPAESPGESD